MKNKKIDNEVMEFVRELLTVITISKHWATSKIPIDGLSQARMLILMYLRDTGSSPMRGLNKHLGTSATNVTGLVDGLELEGLV
ncbi:MarR family transcriptional regulator, partial [Gammaproteobacteria bacterium AH-315-E17]|nr:MarR family transcriptional regulator [Gammaproteobacteria bacterium AH-315-E17]